LPVLELTWQTAVPLILAMAALLATLTLRLPAAYFGRRALLRARKLGRVVEPIRIAVAHASLRREWFRACKGIIIVAAIAVSFIPVPMTAETRNWALSAIALLMLGNSIFDYRTDRSALRYVRMLKPQC
jgi:hypothetical protein